MTMFLDRIISQTSIDLQQRKLIVPFEEQQRLAHVQGAPRDLLQSLKVQSRIGLIAEVKRASPSKGKFVSVVDPVKLAQLYAAHGVAAISVLTEPHFFLGSFDYLTAIKRAVQVPVLCKDFIFDEYQVYEARAGGADAILLIWAILVGESLVTSQDIPAQIRTLLRGAHENVQVKICGLRTTDQILAARDAGADLLGLMFYEPSPRYIQPQAAREILKIYEDGQISPDIVGIFVNKEADYINDVIEQVGLHLVQLHGDESPEFCTCIHRPVFKALRL